MASLTSPYNKFVVWGEVQYFSDFQRALPYIRCPGSERDSDDHRRDPPRLCPGNIAAMEGAVIMFCVVHMVRWIFKSFLVKFYYVHAAILFSVIVSIQSCFCFLCSPVISREGKILPPLIQKGPPLGWKIKKNVWLLILIAQKKGFDALNATQKTLALCKVPFLKKKQEKLAKTVIFDHFDHFWPFWPVFLDFFINGTFQRADVFRVALSASKPFFGAIKINNPTIFLIFHPKGGPFWFRGGKILPSPEIIGLEIKQKRFWNRTTMENKLGTCRILGVDYDENRYPPTIWWGSLVSQWCWSVMFTWWILLSSKIWYYLLSSCWCSVFFCDGAILSYPDGCLAVPDRPAPDDLPGPTHPRVPRLARQEGWQNPTLLL